LHLFLDLGQIFVQSPSQFCSPNRAPDPSPEELAILEGLSLDVRSSASLNVKIALENLGTTSQTDSDGSLSIDHDSKKTVEENEAILSNNKKKRIT